MSESSSNKSRQKVQVVVIAENELLLLEFNTNERHTYHGYQNITGGVEANEDYRTAAIRELYEETGVIADVIELDLQFQFTDRWDHFITEKVFLCVLDHKPVVKICEEHKSFKWIAVQDVHVADYLFSSNYESFQKALETINGSAK